MPVASKDFIAGTLFAAIGLAAMRLGSDYAFGSPAQMGPGFFPLVLCVLLVLLGGTLLIRGLVRGGAVVEPLALRKLALVLAGILGFGILLPWLGLGLTAAVTVTFCIAAGRPGPWYESGLLVIVLTAAVVIIFPVLLKLPIPIWPRGVLF